MAHPAAKRRAAGIALALPSAVALGLFCVAPLLYLGRYSLFVYDPADPLARGVTLASYIRFLTDSYYLGVLAQTLAIAFSVTLAALVLGFPVAYGLARQKSRWRAVCLVLIISPLYVSAVVRAYGWLVILGDGGLINNLLIWLGVVQRPIRMMFTSWAVVVALTEVALPFMILTLASTLQKIDPMLEEAAANLGARPWRVFKEVILPLSMPGIIAGSMLVFILAAGSYATPALIGGRRVKMLVTEVYQQMTAIYNWPFGAAVSFILLILTLLCVAGFSRALSDRWRIEAGR
ncbi:MAG: ABC transporter permease [Proteobacteria bacterium]|nr:ABC transporter permease [Pseudomonadota bacterium]MBI3498268.1 ABC transporter permease [Pseudomonadota bacterium]